MAELLDEEKANELSVRILKLHENIQNTKPIAEHMNDAADQLDAAAKMTRKLSKLLDSAFGQLGLSAGSTIGVIRAPEVLDGFVKDMSPAGNCAEQFSDIDEIISKLSTIQSLNAVSMIDVATRYKEKLEEVKSLFEAAIKASYLPSLEALTEKYDQEVTETIQTGIEASQDLMIEAEELVSELKENDVIEKLSDVSSELNEFRDQIDGISNEGLDKLDSLVDVIQQIRLIVEIISKTSLA